MSKKKRSKTHPKTSFNRRVGLAAVGPEAVFGLLRWLSEYPDSRVPIRLPGWDTDILVGRSGRTSVIMRDRCTCVRCGLMATHAWVERAPGQEECHIGIYGVYPDTGEEALLTHDHVIPKSLGGKDGMTNGACLCYSCNQRKGARVE